MSNVQHQASSVKHYETITVSFWRCSWANLLAMCTRADRIEIPNKWTNHDKLVPIHTAWRKLVSRKTGHSKRAVWRKTMQDPHFHFRIPWLLRLQEPQEGKPEPSCFQRCCWLNTGSRIVLGFCFSVLKFFPRSVHFPCYLQHFEPGSCHFHSIFSIFELEPFILHGICSILVLDAAISKVFAHFWIRTCHFRWDVQHFGARPVHLRLVLSCFKVSLGFFL